MPDNVKWPEVVGAREQPGNRPILDSAYRRNGVKLPRWKRIETETYVPLETIRERLEAEADKLEQQNDDGVGVDDLTAVTVRAVKAQGIRDALAALLDQPPQEERVIKLKESLRVAGYESVERLLLERSSDIVGDEWIRSGADVERLTADIVAVFTGAAEENSDG